MRRFTDLFIQLDQTNKTKDKIEFLESYFLEAPDQDKLWALALFTHKRPKRNVKTAQLREWCREVSSTSEWLFEESYQTVGDLAETISLLLPKTEKSTSKTLSEIIQELLSMKPLSDEEKKTSILSLWEELDQEGRFVFNKLITGGFRIGVSQNLITQAIAGAFKMDKTEVAHRIMGNWNPLTTTFESLILSQNPQDDLSRPYPFCLAHPVEADVASLGRPGEWLLEWKWDGIRGQLIHRNGEVYLWSRGEELITEKFPEIVEIGHQTPSGTVLDGEILPFREGSPLPFGALQTRIGRKNLTKKILTDVPVSFVAYDLLEWGGEDLRALTLEKRREKLELLCNIHPNFRVSELIQLPTWEDLTKEREKSRIKKAEGLMIKKRDGLYEVGRKRGNWWKWKIAPLTVDGVMLYAQKGHGRRADLYTDYTLAVWKEDQLVPFAKAYSGLTDQEIREVDRFVKKHTKERFGPVRTVEPELVFEIAFEGIQESPRHKSGIALRFPRILRWRKDKKPEDANTLTDLQDLLDLYGK
ncbi:ATP-dependent DNA ligase [Pleomorphovibrio marinus]|uniref:ATP-dependent DNA ligase n=1 Tax=Pleomorphovibrio marinus TaxID=2164132 RepID=UPI000E0AC8B7|nr:ATP-dependent DNA ligase [Pleomorphovibrio marinus]